MDLLQPSLVFFKRYETFYRMITLRFLGRDGSVVAQTRVIARECLRNTYFDGMLNFQQREKIENIFTIDVSDIFTPWEGVLVAEALHDRWVRDNVKVNAEILDYLCVPLDLFKTKQNARELAEDMLRRAMRRWSLLRITHVIDRHDYVCFMDGMSQRRVVDDNCSYDCICHRFNDHPLCIRHLSDRIASKHKII